MDNLISKTIQFRARTIGEKQFLIGNGQCYEINESTKIIWKALNGKRNIEDIIAILKNEFAIDENDNIHEMVSQCIDSLVEIGAAK